MPSPPVLVLYSRRNIKSLEKAGGCGTFTISLPIFLRGLKSPSRINAGIEFGESRESPVMLYNLLEQLVNKLVDEDDVGVFGGGLL